jgi:chemotaxis protein methyltransferase CheR
VDFEYTDADFRRIARHVYQRAGIVLTEAKRSLAYGRLVRRLRALGIDRFADYLDRLEANRSSEEWQHFVNALTTNLTSFFRENYHFDILTEQMKAMPGPFRIWCAAASTGEEPYSLAMTACDARGVTGHQVEIVASDIDTKVLATAESGIYPLGHLDKMSLVRKQAYFQRGGGSQLGAARVKPPLRDMVSYRQINLLADHWPLDGVFHAIFCRNVLIYFDAPTQQRVLRNMARYLRPDGRLYVGHSENLRAIDDVYLPCGRAVYGLVRGH